MEVYKDVERTSKLKTFSNQSILMASLENTTRDDDDDDDDDDEDFNFDDNDSTEEDEEDTTLGPEAVEAIKFLKDIISQISEQTKKLNSEYEKLSQKKLRKNNLSIIESKKEKIQSSKDLNKFHTKKIMKIIKLLRSNKLIDTSLIWVIKEDLINYVSSNSNSENAVVNDSTLYDDIFNLITPDDDYSEIHDSEVFSTPVKELPKQSQILLNGSNYSNGHAKDILTSELTSQNDAFSHKTPSPKPRHVSSPEISNPGIIKILKPATTPSKPIGGLKWSAAAVAGILDSETMKPVEVKTQSVTPQVPMKVESQKDLSVKPIIKSASTTSEGSQEGKISKYVQVLKNSSLSSIELNLFSDPNLHKLPPGMQDLIISFTSKRNNSHDFRLLYDSNEFNQFVSPIHKPYSPHQIQPLLNNNYNSAQFKPPLQLFKLQSYWNKIRAGDQFEQFLIELESLTAQNNVENGPIINEFALVLFYGYYYGLTPIENLIAESCLLKLGWRPYRNRIDDSLNKTISPGNSVKFSGSTTASSNYLYWFKCIKLISTEEATAVEYGDYQVFDLSTWEIFVKFGFKFDNNLSQLAPSTVLC
ncbi:uncharacterized protein CANTADRAFT_49120 [Suhomyces tanzawaensis NRRL Y-17324]|uniref:CCR4-Not complex component Not N-terminal domain-containing protein n=1 Tax=Suhomyces tanzawaensis NRRL Y-17324 TaxID=984487 RepID=A0A1E4SJN2_9ASCO|nr:uncharacterized protein CANTADRAFT_49120 [Suhomyces tanzawaensis NRRL Y-17324]ODV79700.1 hypothetical protein CANTADRAFT_49120 [Suhomyces tanzawaensis NRRL Y-17324]